MFGIYKSKRIKKITAIFLAIISCISLMTVCFNVFAYGGTKVTMDDGITYEIFKDHASVYSADTSLSGNVTIPDKVNKLKVTQIETKAFVGCDGIESITLGKYIEEIGLKAFYNCSGLMTIKLNSRLNTIDKQAFYGCTGLKSLKIPSKLQSIGDSAFEGCTGLSTITFSTDETKTIKNNLSSLGASCFAGCTSLSKITFPSELNSIGEKCFMNCTGLKTVTLNSGLSSIPVSAFENTPISSLTIPNSVTAIEKKAFSNCAYLKTIKIGCNVSKIGDYAFYKCINLKSVELPATVTSIGNYAFAEMTQLSNIHLGNATTIGTNCFENDLSLKTLVLPDNLIKLPQKLISGSGMHLETVVIGQKTTTISTKAFYGSSAKTPVKIDTLIIPSSVNRMELSSLGIKQVKKTDKETGDETYTLTSYCVIDNIVYEGDEDEIKTLLENSEQNGLLINEEASLETGYTYTDEKGSCRIYGTRSYSDLAGTVINLPKEKHNFKTTITSATTKKDGSQINKCQNCGTLISSKKVPKIKNIELEYTDCAYDGAKHQPKITAYDTDGNVIPSTYYSVVYSGGCKEVGKYSVTVTFKNRYSGTLKTSFSIINEKPIAVRVRVEKSGEHKGQYRIRWHEVLGADGYTIYYSRTKDSGYTTLKTRKAIDWERDDEGRYIYYCNLKNDNGYFFYVKAYKSVKGEKIYGYRSYIRTITGTFTLNTYSYIYDGSQKTPVVTAYDEYGTIINKNNYTVTYDSGRKNIGRYRVRIEFKGPYTGYGVRERSFKIIPGKVEELKVKTKDKKTLFTFKQMKGGVKYQIYFAPVDTKGKVGTYKKLGETSSNEFTSSELKANTLYSFKVRAIKKISGSTYYGEFSNPITYRTSKTLIYKK